MVHFAIYETQLGFFKIGYEGEVIVLLQKVEKEDINEYGIKTELSNQVFQQLIEYIEGKRRSFDFPYELRGTDFQNKVWQELCKIPYGETRSYKEIARAIGNEKACRAVGMANNKNPIIIVVPCHRVVGANGKLVGYAGGISMKQHLLDMEKLKSIPLGEL